MIDSDADANDCNSSYQTVNFDCLKAA